MANSKYSYVKDFEKDDRILPQVWIVVRVDGRSFTKFSEDHEFQKPNDERCLRLMEQSAAKSSKVLENFDDCILAYGQSDEFSFILRRDTNIFNRRESKILSCIVSLFSSSFVYYWKQFFEEIDLKYPPSFDARVVVYPSEKSLRDYLSWRQVDCHINNQYNVCFWSLVQNGMSPNEAYTLLKGTFADFKNELLFQRFGIIYSSISSRFRKGSIVFKNPVLTTQKSKFPCKVMISHEDLIGDEFWMQHPYLLCTSAKGWNSIIRQSMFDLSWRSVDPKPMRKNMCERIKYMRNERVGRVDVEPSKTKKKRKGPQVIENQTTPNELSQKNYVDEGSDKRRRKMEDREETERESQQYDDSQVVVEEDGFIPPPPPPPPEEVPPPPPEVPPPPPSDDLTEEDEMALLEAMGLPVSFDSTKGQHVEGNDVGAANIKRKRTYRQYMNRPGGFNRPLDPLP